MKGNIRPGKKENRKKKEIESGEINSLFGWSGRGWKRRETKKVSLFHCLDEKKKKFKFLQAHILCLPNLDKNGEKLQMLTFLNSQNYFCAHVFFFYFLYFIRK